MNKPIAKTIDFMPINVCMDLLLRTDTTGIKFYGLVERLRETLKKNVDVLEVRQLTNNPELINEILRDGVKIYG